MVSADRGSRTSCPPRGRIAVSTAAGVDYTIDGDGFFDAFDAATGATLLKRPLSEDTHAVMILRGHGQCLLGETVRELKPLDLVTIPSRTWHQFRANAGEPLGFVCMVNHVRDKPELPSERELAALRANPEIAAFLAS